jgi:hypothetical protein
MLEITFQYKDQYTNGEWRTQHCKMPSIEECIEKYGLGDDCEYRFIKIFYLKECQYNNRFRVLTQIENCIDCPRFYKCEDIHDK